MIRSIDVGTMRLLFYFATIVFVFCFKLVGSQIIRINAGGEKFVDTLGQTWEADTYYNRGKTAVDCLVPIKGTSLQSLYCSYRWFDKTSQFHQYEVPIASGTYRVKLHFAEM